MRHILSFAAVLTVSLCLSTAEAAPGWEKIASEKEEIADVVSQETVETKVVDGAVWLRLPAKSSVKVFTILGQLVAEQQLEAGLWRLPLSARGIYILKIGTVTRRVTI